MKMRLLLMTSLMTFTVSTFAASSSCNSYSTLMSSRVLEVKVDDSTGPEVATSGSRADEEFAITVKTENSQNPSSPNTFVIKYSNSANDGSIDLTVENKKKIKNFFNECSKLGLLMAKELVETFNISVYAPNEVYENGCQAGGEKIAIINKDVNGARISMSCIVESTVNGVSRSSSKSLVLND